MAVNFSFEELVLLSIGRIIDKILPTLAKKSFFFPLKLIFVSGSSNDNSISLYDFLSIFG